MDIDGAEDYLHSLIFPEEGGAQIPDLMLFPSMPLHYKGVFSLSGVTGSGTTTNAFMGICFSPNLNAFSATLGGVASGVLSWNSTVNWSGYTTASSNFALYRVVSMGFRVINSTALQNRAGICYTGMSVAQTGSSDFPVTLGGFTGCESIQMGSFSQEYACETPRQTWLPARICNTEYIPVTQNTTYPGSSDPFMVCLIDCGSATAQTVSVEVYLNLEVVPYCTTTWLFDATPKVGDPSTIISGFYKEAPAIVSGLGATLQEMERKYGPIVERAGSWMNVMGGLGGKAADETSDTYRAVGLIRDLRSLVHSIPPQPALDPLLRALDALPPLVVRRMGVWGRDQVLVAASTADGDDATEVGSSPVIVPSAGVTSSPAVSFPASAPSRSEGASSARSRR